MVYAFLLKFETWLWTYEGTDEGCYDEVSKPKT